MEVEAVTTNLTLDMSAVNLPQAAGVYGFFSRTTPDAGSGQNELTIYGLPTGTRFISVWMTEFTLSNGGSSHAGGAYFYTQSVQLFENGTKCRVRFSLAWGTSLPAGCQVIFGQ
jgi:hypothetical protein